LTGSPSRNYELNLSSSTLSPGEYAPVSLYGKAALAVLAVAADGCVSNYVPMPEIPAYATIVMQVQSK